MAEGLFGGLQRFLGFGSKPEAPVATPATAPTGTEATIATPTATPEPIPTLTPTQRPEETTDAALGKIKELLETVQVPVGAPDVTKTAAPTATKVTPTFTPSNENSPKPIPGLHVDGFTPTTPVAGPENPTMGTTTPLISPDIQPITPHAGADTPTTGAWHPLETPSVSPSAAGAEAPKPASFAMRQMPDTTPSAAPQTESTPTPATQHTADPLADYGKFGYQGPEDKKKTTVFIAPLPPHALAGNPKPAEAAQATGPTVTHETASPAAGAIKLDTTPSLPLQASTDAPVAAKGPDKMTVNWSDAGPATVNPLPEVVKAPEAHQAPPMIVVNKPAAEVNPQSAPTPPTTTPTVTPTSQAK